MPGGAHTFAIIDLLRMACYHGYPVRVTVAGVHYDGWVRGSSTPSSVTVCLGEQSYDFEWADIEDASFYTSLAERLTGAWITRNA